MIVESLLDRVKNSIDEVILLQVLLLRDKPLLIFEESLKNINVKISKLAQGLPVGGEIENLDDGTLFSALQNRTQL